MKQLFLPFTENADIPESHLYAFRVCNSAGEWAYKSSFYKLKNELLLKYAHEADYDLQHIVKTCHSCDGKGNHHTGSQCYRCDKGVYARKKVILKRWILNGAVFHQPVGELVDGTKNLKIFSGYYEDEYNGEDYPAFKYETFTGRIVSEILGYIKHEPIGLHPIWAFYYLLWNYDREGFFKMMNSDLKNLQTNTQYRLKKLLKKFSPLKAYAEFFEVKKGQLADIDDLPF